LLIISILNIIECDRKSITCLYTYVNVTLVHLVVVVTNSVVMYMPMNVITPTKLRRVYRGMTNPMVFIRVDATDILEVFKVFLTRKLIVITTYKDFTSIHLAEAIMERCPGERYISQDKHQIPLPHCHVPLGHKNGIMLFNTIALTILPGKPQDFLVPEVEV
jgi:hypothetical protein